MPFCRVNVALRMLERCRTLNIFHGDELAAASRLEDMNSLYRAANFYQTTSPDVANLFHVDPEAKRPSLVLLNKQEEKLTVYGISSLNCFSAPAQLLSISMY